MGLGAGMQGSAVERACVRARRRAAARPLGAPAHASVMVASSTWQHCCNLHHHPEHHQQEQRISGAGAHMRATRLAPCRAACVLRAVPGASQEGMPAASGSAHVAAPSVTAGLGVNARQTQVSGCRRGSRAGRTRGSQLGAGGGPGRRWLEARLWGRGSETGWRGAGGGRWGFKARLWGRGAGTGWRGAGGVPLGRR